MSTCPECGGFIGEPNTTYGYGGKWCQCVPRLEYSTPFKKEEARRCVNCANVYHDGIVNQCKVVAFKQKDIDPMKFYCASFEEKK